MTIAKNATSKLFVAMVAAAMVFTLAHPAKAATAEELQAQIDALMAQISGLQGGGSATASTAACTFTRPLTVGSQGEDVKCLQNAMTPTYFNNAGGATGYFGPVTQAAVAKWQAANGVTPAAGYFGPISQAKFAAMAPAGDDTTGDDDDDTTASDDDDDDSSSTELTGEASLKSFETNDGEDVDDVEEGSEELQVAEFQIEFSDGDAKITRLDIAASGTSDGNDEIDPWKVFEEFSLWVDGDKVADIDASDKDNYLDEDDGSLRFAGLDIVAKEDKEITVTVAATVKSSVDGVSDGADWDIAAGAIRFVDADDVTTTDTTQGDLQSLSASDRPLENPASFTIDEAGAGDDLELKTSSEDPDAHTISLDEDNNTEEPIFAFDLSAKDSDGDVVLSNLVSVDVNLPSVAGGATIDTIVNDFRLEIDGQSFDAESYTGSGVHATVDFDIDGDVTIDADKTVTAVLYADFEDMATANEGTTISASTSASQIDAEGDKSGETVSVGGSAKNGDTHTLRTQGLDLGDVTDGTGSSDSTQVVSGVATDANYGTMFLEYEITAFGDDLYVKASDAVRGASSTAGVAYTIEDSSTGSATTTGAVSVSYDIDGADESNGFFLLEDGETYKMTVTVNSYNPVGTGGTYNLQILTVGFADSEINADNTEAPSDLNDYESDDVAIQS